MNARRIIIPMAVLFSFSASYTLIPHPVQAGKRRSIRILNTQQKKACDGNIQGCAASGAAINQILKGRNLLTRFW